MLINKDSKLRELWERIESFEMDDSNAARPFSSVLAEEMEWDEEFTELAITEYKKFMLLANFFPEEMVPSIDVDTVWHLHLLYTRSYQEFCQQALGRTF